MSVTLKENKNNLKNKNIAIIWGGESFEKEISFQTAKAVETAIKNLGLKGYLIELTYKIAAELKNKDIDLAFLATHGKYGEDGCLQGLLEILKIPYTGSGVLASALSMDKIYCKYIFISQNIPIPQFFVSEDNILPKIPFDLPIVVKPASGGSALGVSIVKKIDDFVPACEEAKKYDQRILIEKYIKGKEMSAAILGDEVLPLIEIIPQQDFYNFEAKYIPGMSKHIIPASLKEDLISVIEKIVKNAFFSLGCRVFGRVDFILDEKGNMYVLEVNTIPGMTSTSLFPEAAKAKGISFEELILRIINYSLDYFS